MDSALAILGFYFTLIGFISGLFFTRLDGWYGSVREYAGKLAVMIARRAKREKFVDAQIELKGLQASQPLGSFIAVGLLTSGLVVLSLFVPVNSPTLNPLVFVQLPLIVTVVAYWIGGLYLLFQGASALEKAENEISEALKG